MLAAFIKQGYKVLLPFGGCLRYDMAIDDGHLHRIQVKTGRLINGAVRFAGSSVQRDTNKRSPYYGEADYFGIYCPELEKVYLVPVDLVPAREISLRIDATRNNQQRGVRWAHDYELTPL